MFPELKLRLSRLNHANGGFGKAGGLVLSFVTASLWGLLLVAAIAYRFFLKRKQLS
jgi:hypothetical protein